jgi:hypothetical protein
MQRVIAHPMCLMRDRSREQSWLIVLVASQTSTTTIKLSGEGKHCLGQLRARADAQPIHANSHKDRREDRQQPMMSLTFLRGAPLGLLQ